MHYTEIIITARLFRHFLYIFMHSKLLDLETLQILIFLHKIQLVLPLEEVLLPGHGVKQAHRPTQRQSACIFM